MTSDRQPGRTTQLDDVRRRIEIQHGNIIAQRATNDPPTGKEDMVKAAYDAGCLAGLQSALYAFREDMTEGQDSDVNDAYRALSVQFQDVDEVARVNPQQQQRGGFQ